MEELELDKQIIEESIMSGNKRLGLLKDYITEKTRYDGIKAELIENTGRDDFFIVFISICNKKTRALVFHGSGSTLEQAWNNAEKNLEIFKRKAIKDKKIISAIWIKVDVVTSFKEIPVTELNNVIIKNEWTNFTRVGISLDPDFKNAFLEAELNSNKMIKYYSEKEVAAKIYDYNSIRLSLSNINNYLKLQYGSGTLDSIPEKITIFNTTGFFCGEDDVIVDLYNSSLDHGRRKIDKVTGNYIRGVIRDAAEYLGNLIDKNGKFIYGYFPIFDNVMTNYNIVRHVSSIWSLINLYRMTEDKSVLQKLNSSIEYAISYIESEDDETSYLVERDIGEIKLGGCGVAIVMLSEYMDVFGVNDRFIEIITKLANGILKLQDPLTGKYWHVLKFPGYDRKEEFRTVYYDGEATFALGRAYTYTKNKRFLDGAAAALENFINNNYIRHRDHWVAYAFSEVTKYIKDAKYYEYALQNADKNLDAIKERVTSFHTYLELLMAAWTTYKRALKENVNSDYIKNYDPCYFAQTIYHRARHMLNGFFYPEYAMYMKSPSKIVLSFMVRHQNFRVRIDDVQHFIGGYYLFSIFYDDIKQYLSDEFIDSYNAE